MYGLLMMGNYLEEILSGQKNDDARLYPTDKRGKIALVDSSTLKVHGTAELVGVEETTYEYFVKWHQTGRFANVPIAPYHEGKTCYSYRLENVVRLVHPVRLNHERGKRMWIELTDSEVKSFGYQKTLFDIRM